MDCRETKELMPAYLEDDLTGDLKSSVSEHLKGCAGCTGELKAIEATLSLIKTADEVEPPPFFAKKIVANIRAEAGAYKPSLFDRLFRPFHVKIPIQIVSMVFVAALGAYIYSSLETGIRPSETEIISRSVMFDKVVVKDEAIKESREAAADLKKSDGKLSEGISAVREKAPEKKAVKAKGPVITGHGQTIELPESGKAENVRQDRLQGQIIGSSGGLGGMGARGESAGSMSIGSLGIQGAGRTAGIRRPPPAPETESGSMAGSVERDRGYAQQAQSYNLQSPVAPGPNAPEEVQAQERAPEKKRQLVREETMVEKPAGQPERLSDANDSAVGGFALPPAFKVSKSSVAKPAGAMALGSKITPAAEEALTATVTVADLKTGANRFEEALKAYGLRQLSKSVSWDKCTYMVVGSVKNIKSLFESMKKAAKVTAPPLAEDPEAQTTVRIVLIGDQQ